MSYWTNLTHRRIGRRRALVATTALTASAAFLAACGGGSDGESDEPERSLPDSIHRPVDSTASAVHGGTWRSYIVRDPQNFDLYNFDPFSQPFANAVGSKLVKMKPGRMEDPTLTVDPDISEDWEISPDYLTVTFHLHPNARWAPANTPFYQDAPDGIGDRVIDSEDVLASWERWGATLSASGADELVNSRVPSAPVVSVEAPDPQTVVMHLNQPFSPLLVSLGNGSVSYFYIMPKEIKDGSLDPFRHQFGSGPFQIESYEPSVRIRLARNPNYELRDTEFRRPYVDEVELPIVPDSAQQLAQFRAGTFFMPTAGGLTGAANRPIEDVLQLKQDFPALQLLAFRGADTTQMWFGMREDSPWRDERVRQAMSMSWDRDLYITAIHGTDVLEDAGIPGNHEWNAAYPVGEFGIGAFPGWYLDPQDEQAFGENARFFRHDVTEAKALLAAAGHPDGLTFKHVQYPIAPGAQQRSMDVIEGLFSEAGFTVREQEQVTIPEIFTDYINNGGQFSDLLNTLDFGGPDPAAYFRTHLHHTGSLFGGWDANSGPANPGGDPFLNENIDRMFVEFDEEVRQGIAHDIIRYMGRMNYKMRYPGAGTQLGLAWPALQNVYVWRGYGLSGAFSYEWLDTTKAPLA